MRQSCTSRSFVTNYTRAPPPPHTHRSMWCAVTVIGTLGFVWTLCLALATLVRTISTVPDRVTHQGCVQTLPRTATLELVRGACCYLTTWEHTIPNFISNTISVKGFIYCYRLSPHTNPVINKSYIAEITSHILPHHFHQRSPLFHHISMLWEHTGS